MPYDEFDKPEDFWQYYVNILDSEISNLKHDIRCLDEKIKYQERIIETYRHVFFELAYHHGFLNEIKSMFEES